MTVSGSSLEAVPKFALPCPPCPTKLKIDNVLTFWRIEISRKETKPDREPPR